MNRTFTLLFTLLISTVPAWAQTRPVVTWMGVIGDSTVTGAAADPRLDPFPLEMIGRLLNLNVITPGWPAYYVDYSDPAEFNITEPIEPVTRVTYSLVEKSEARAKGRGAAFSQYGEGALSQTLDVEEYSFAYMIGRSLNIRGRNIVIAAQDGQKASTLSRQARRLLDFGGGHLPPLVLVSYGLNDICHPNDVAGDVADFKARFLQTVRAELAAVAAMPVAEGGGTRILISAPLDATNLMVNENLLSQTIAIEGAGWWRGRISCKELRDGSAKLTSVGEGMRSLLIGECRGLREETNDWPGRAQKVRALQMAQIEAWQQAISEIQTSGLTIQLGGSVRNVRFASGDLANDCFHPGISAHEKIARGFLENELRDLRDAAKP